MAVRKLLAGLYGRRRNVLLGTPREGACAVVAAEISGEVVRRFGEDPAVRQAIDARARGHPGGELAAGAGRRLATGPLE